MGFKLLLSCFLIPIVCLANPSEELNLLLNRYVAISIAESPETATFNGISGFDDRWTDMSLEALEQRDLDLKNMLQEAKNFKLDTLSQNDQMNLKVFLYVLEDIGTFKEEYMPLNQMHGLQTDLGLVLGIMPTHDLQAFENIFARLEKIPTLILQTLVLLEKGLETSILPPKITQEAIPDQLSSLITKNPRDSYLFQPFTKLPSHFSIEEKETLEKRGEDLILTQVFPALQNLKEFLIQSYIPYCREGIAISELPNGKKWYEACIRFHTTTDLTAEEVHAIGRNEVARIRDEMKKILTLVNFEGNLSSFLIFLREDPRFYYTVREDLLQGYRDILKKIEQTLTNLFGKFPKNAYEVVAVPKNTENTATGAYYLRGSEKAGRPGRFYANTSHLHSRPKWDMEALALHEALPGHHMQISLALENESLHEFRKLVHFTGYIEGWGLYSESLGSELGLYKDPYSLFGRLCAENFRAVRLVIDTGIHAFGWTREQAIEYFLANTSLGLHEIETEVDRYIAWPGQALAYKIGEMKIREMRNLATQKLGSQFNIRDFHDAVLEHGALPLQVFEDTMKAWINQQVLLGDRS